MRCPQLRELPSPPPGRTGWPWTMETRPLPPTMADGSDWPLIRVATPSYNQGRFLEETIRSVLLQGYPNLEYTIRDGGGSDESVEIIRRYEPWITSWVSEPDGGQADAINRGLMDVSADLVAFLNSDDIYYATALRRAAECHRRDPARILFGKGMWIDAESRPIAEYPTFRPSFYAFEWTCTLCQPTVFLPLEVFRTVGPFNAGIYASFDFEYWFRCLEKGARFRCVNHLVAGSRMYWENKSLSRQAKVTEEGQALRRRFLDGRRLNPLLRKWSYWRVLRPTLKRTRVLLEHLERGRRSPVS